MRDINQRAVSIIRYGVGIINWTKEELRKMDRNTRKLLTIHNTMHPQKDVNRLYMKVAEGGRHDQVGKWIHCRLCLVFIATETGMIMSQS